MKKSYTLLTSSILLGLAATSAQAVSLYDYQEAKPSYTDAKVDATFNYQTNKNNTAVQGQKDSYNLNLNFDYERVFSTPIRDIEFAANVNGNSNRNSAGVKSNDYAGAAGAGVFNYFKPNSKGAFVYGSAIVADQKDRKNYFAETYVGAGYGRVVDATPMSQAIWIVKELRKQDKLTGDLSVADYQSLASVIGKKEEYAARLSRSTDNYRETWVADMANVINASGKAKGALDAAAVLRVYDVVENGLFVTRRIGTRVRAGVGSIIKNYDQDKGKPSVQIVGEFHRPVSNDWQFSNVTTLSGTVDSSNNGYNLDNVMSFDRQINAKSIWENSWQANRNKPNSGSATTTNTLSSGYRYALGNRVSLYSVLQSSKTTGAKTDTSLQAGISYKLR